MKYLIPALFLALLPSCLTSADLRALEDEVAVTLQNQDLTSQEKLDRIGAKADEIADDVEERTKNVLRVPFSSGDPVTDLIVWGLTLMTGAGAGVNTMRNRARAKRGELVATDPVAVKTARERPSPMG